MKKLFALLFAVAMIFAGPLPAAAENGHGSLPQKEIEKVMKSFKRKKGFKMSSVGSFEIGLIKSVGKSAKDVDESELDDDTREVLRMLSVFENLKSVKTLEFEDASAENREAFVTAMSEVLKDVPMYEDIDKDGLVTFVYGYRAEDGESYDGLAALSMDEGAFLLIEGLLSLDKLEILMEED